jgi:hypothetical protein
MGAFGDTAEAEAVIGTVALGAVVAGVHAHFAGHGAAAGDPGQPDPRPADRRLWYCGVIEPNAWGAHEIRCTWWRAIEQAGWLS